MLSNIIILLLKSPPHFLSSIAQTHPTKQALRKACKVDNVNGWGRGKKIERNNHVERMTDNRKVKIARGHLTKEDQQEEQ
jgi:hypothetical protein